MIDDLHGLDLATGEFGPFLDGVSAEHLALSTPCPEWDVRYLVAHVVGGNRFASLVLDGVPSSVAVERIMSTAQLSDRPARDFASSSDEQRRRFRLPGVLEGVVDHPLGVTGGPPVPEVPHLRLHPARLGPRHGDRSRRHARPRPGGRGPADSASRAGGMGFGVEATAAVGGSKQQQLLALTGRA